MPGRSSSRCPPVRSRCSDPAAALPLHCQQARSGPRGVPGPLRAGDLYKGQNLGETKTWEEK